MITINRFDVADMIFGVSAASIAGYRKRVGELLKAVRPHGTFGA